MLTDLFGNKIERKETESEGYLKQQDIQRFDERIKRFDYLKKITPEEFALAGNMELVFTYRELQQVYVDGHFLSVILLGQSWIEKNLQSYYESIGLLSVSKKGSAAMIKHSIENKILNGIISQKMDKFRLIRNPIAHL